MKDARDLLKRSVGGNLGKRFEIEDERETLRLQALAGIAALLQLVEPTLTVERLREGLLRTPERWVKAMLEATTGYGQDPQLALGTTFDADGYDEMVVKTGIDFTSLCEHHLLPFVGTVTVGYIPAQRVVGLSKLSRVVDVFSHRLQIQERMTVEIANAVEQALSPRGVGVVVRGEHSCVACRGVRKLGTTMVTSALRGVLRDDPAARAEFLELARKGEG